MLTSVTTAKMARMPMTTVTTTVWTRATARALRGAEAEKVRLSVELCTVYWHFLLLVWAVLFAVLLNTHQ